MIGDADQQIYKEQNSTPWLVEQVWATAAKLGYDKWFLPTAKYSMLDDHTPFLRKGIPAVDIIDFDYPYWHTTQDTADKVSRGLAGAGGPCAGNAAGREPDQAAREEARHSSEKRTPPRIAAAVRVRHAGRQAEGTARPGRGRHQARHRQPGRAAARLCRRGAAPVGVGPDPARLRRLYGHAQAAPGDGRLLRRAASASRSTWRTRCCPCWGAKRASPTWRWPGWIPATWRSCPTRAIRPTLASVAMAGAQAYLHAADRGKRLAARSRRHPGRRRRGGPG